MMRSGGLFLLIVLLAACSPDKDESCGIDPGQMVVSKLDGRPGMVTYAYRYGYRITVRFASLQATTDTHALGADGAIEFSPYSTVDMQCFEVEMKR